MNQEEIQEKIRMEQQLAMLEELAKQNMSRDAVSRFGNLKVAHPEMAVQLMAFIAQGVQAGRIQEKISDETLKNILSSLQQPKKEFRLTRK